MGGIQKLFQAVHAHMIRGSGGLTAGTLGNASMNKPQSSQQPQKLQNVDPRLTEYAGVVKNLQENFPIIDLTTEEENIIFMGSKKAKVESGVARVKTERLSDEEKSKIMELKAKVQALDAVKRKLQQKLNVKQEQLDRIEKLEEKYQGIEKEIKAAEQNAPSGASDDESDSDTPLLEDQSPDKIYEEGAKFEDEGNYTKAMEMYLKAAHQNHSQAQFAIGMMYIDGRGVDKNVQEGKKWLWMDKSNIEMAQRILDELRAEKEEDERQVREAQAAAERAAAEEKARQEKEEAERKKREEQEAAERAAAQEMARQEQEQAAAERAAAQKKAREEEARQEKEEAERKAREEQEAAERAAAEEKARQEKEEAERKAREEQEAAERAAAEKEKAERLARQVEREKELKIDLEAVRVASTPEGFAALKTKADQGDPVAQADLAFYYYKGKKPLTEHDCALARKYYKLAEENMRDKPKHKDEYKPVCFHLGRLYELGKGGRQNLKGALELFKRGGLRTSIERVSEAIEKQKAADRAAAQTKASPEKKEAELKKGEEQVAAEPAAAEEQARQEKEKANAARLIQEYPEIRAQLLTNEIKDGNLLDPNQPNDISAFGSMLYFMHHSSVQDETLGTGIQNTITVMKELDKYGIFEIMFDSEIEASNELMIRERLRRPMETNKPGLLGRAWRCLTASSMDKKLDYSYLEDSVFTEVLRNPPFTTQEGHPNPPKFKDVHFGYKCDKDPLQNPIVGKRFGSENHSLCEVEFNKLSEDAKQSYWEGKMYSPKITYTQFQQYLQYWNGIITCVNQTVDINGTPYSFSTRAGLIQRIRKESQNGNLTRREGLFYLSRGIMRVLMKEMNESQKEYLEIMFNGENVHNIVSYLAFMIRLFPNVWLKRKLFSQPCNQGSKESASFRKPFAATLFRSGDASWVYFIPEDRLICKLLDIGVQDMTEKEKKERKARYKARVLEIETAAKELIQTYPKIQAQFLNEIKDGNLIDPNELNDILAFGSMLYFMHHSSVDEKELKTGIQDTITVMKKLDRYGIFEVYSESDIQTAIKKGPSNTDKPGLLGRAWRFLKRIDEGRTSDGVASNVSYPDLLRERSFSIQNMLMNPPFTTQVGHPDLPDFKDVHFGEKCDKHPLQNPIVGRLRYERKIEDDDDDDDEDDDDEDDADDDDDYQLLCQDAYDELDKTEQNRYQPIPTDAKSTPRITYTQFQQYLQYWDGSVTRHNDKLPIFEGEGEGYSFSKREAIKKRIQKEFNKKLPVGWFSTLSRGIMRVLRKKMESNYVTYLDPVDPTLKLETSTDKKDATALKIIDYLAFMIHSFSNVWINQETRMRCGDETSDSSYKFRKPFKGYGQKEASNIGGFIVEDRIICYLLNEGAQPVDEKTKEEYEAQYDQRSKDWLNRISQIDRALMESLESKDAKTTPKLKPETKPDLTLWDENERTTSYYTFMYKNNKAMDDIYDFYIRRPNEFEANFNFLDSLDLEKLTEFFSYMRENVHRPRRSGLLERLMKTYKKYSPGFERRDPSETQETLTEQVNNAAQELKKTVVSLLTGSSSPKPQTLYGYKAPQAIESLVRSPPFTVVHVDAKHHPEAKEFARFQRIMLYEDQEEARKKLGIPDIVDMKPAIEKLKDVPHAYKYILQGIFNHIYADEGDDENINDYVNLDAQAGPQPKHAEIIAYMMYTLADEWEQIKSNFEKAQDIESMLSYFKNVGMKGAAAETEEGADAETEQDADAGTEQDEIPQPLNLKSQEQFLKRVEKEQKS